MSHHPPSPGDGFAHSLGAASPAERVAQSRELLAAGRAAEALAAAELALAIAPSMVGAGMARAAAIKVLEAGDPALTALELTAVIRGEDTRAQLDLAHAYAEDDRPADAERYFKRALALAPGLSAAHAGLGALYLSVGIEDGAEHHSRLALQGDPGHAVASQTLAEILERRGEVKAAAALLDEAYARQSLFLEPGRDSGMTVLVLSTRSAGNIPYRKLLPPGRWTRLVWYMEHAREADLAALPAYDVVFNAIGDPDLAVSSRSIVERFLAHNRRPVFNDPDAIARTSRNLAPAALGDLADVTVPATERIGREEIRRLGLRRVLESSGLEPPLLLRPAGSHGGMGLERAMTMAELEALIPAAGGEDLYATAYHDYRSPDGLYRKGRVIFVDRRPFPYHWAGSAHWMVHYETSGTGDDAARRAEELRFLQDPPSVTGSRAWQAIRRIGERLDLDYCGLDFSVLADGRVLVFEANATMLVHSEDPDGPLAYKVPAVAPIAEAFQRRLAALAEL